MRRLNSQNVTSPQRPQDAIITSLLRQNNVATSLWRNNDVICESRAHWIIVSAGARLFMKPITFCIALFPLDVVLTLPNIVSSRRHQWMQRREWMQYRCVSPPRPKDVYLYIPVNCWASFGLFFGKTHFKIWKLRNVGHTVLIMWYVFFQWSISCYHQSNRWGSRSPT